MWREGGIINFFFLCIRSNLKFIKAHETHRFIQTHLLTHAKTHTYNKEQPLVKARKRKSSTEEKTNRFNCPLIQIQGEKIQSTTTAAAATVVQPAGIYRRILTFFFFFLNVSACPCVCEWEYRVLLCFYSFLCYTQREKDTQKNNWGHERINTRLGPKWRKRRRQDDWVEQWEDG